MRVFLIHGMGRTTRAMLPLSRVLREAGHAPLLFGYRVRRESFADISRAFLHFVRQHVEEAEPGDADYAIIGHSLGNIITRHISGELPDPWRRFVMLAPPNRPARLAQNLRSRLLFQQLTQSAGQNLGDPTFYATLPVPTVPTLVFAGELGFWGRFLPRAERSSDGVVSVEETRLEGVTHRIVPALHTFMMNHPIVHRETLHFLASASLADPST